MKLNLRDPLSIAAWYLVHPERHGPQLMAIGRLRPQFQAAIRQAAKLTREAQACSDNLAGSNLATAAASLT